MSQCSIEGCEKSHSAKSYCRMHYTRFRRHGDPTFTKVEMHGLHRLFNKEYAVWIAMKDRCNNPNNKFYKDYGGRGIEVCEEWTHSFKRFMEDMGPKPEGYSIDRTDNDSGYSPDNCCWATMKEQATHRRITRDKLGRWKPIMKGISL